MDRQPRHLRSLLAALTIAAAGAQSAPAWADRLFSETEVHEVFEGLRSGSLEPAFASQRCSGSLDLNFEGDDLRDVMATFLDVPADSALSAFCDALVVAIVDGRLTLSGLLQVARNQGSEDEALFEVGRLLRAIYFAHGPSPSASLEGGTAQ